MKSDKQHKRTLGKRDKALCEYKEDLPPRMCNGFTDPNKQTIRKYTHDSLSGAPAKQPKSDYAQSLYRDKPQETISATFCQS